jgi:hypothetical protein
MKVDFRIKLDNTWSGGSSVSIQIISRCLLVCDAFNFRVKMEAARSSERWYPNTTRRHKLEDMDLKHHVVKTSKLVL